MDVAKRTLLVTLGILAWLVGGASVRRAWRHETLLGLVDTRGARGAGDVIAWLAALAFHALCLGIHDVTVRAVHLARGQIRARLCLAHSKGPTRQTRNTPKHDNMSRAH